MICLFVKMVHSISSTILFSPGIGSAFSLFVV